MENDFKTSFSGYTNDQLLGILKTPAHYQPAALEAAKEILEGRGINPDLLQSANTATVESEESTTLLSPEENVEHPPLPVRVGEMPEWGYGFFVVVFLVDGFMLLQNWNSFMASRKSSYDDLKANPVMLAMLLLIPAMMILLFMKNKWGWTLCCALAAFSLSSIVISGLLSSRTIREEGLGTIAILSVFLHALICYGLNQKKMYKAFGIGRKEFDYALVVAVVLLVLFFAFN
jgi:hypothetical protein